MSKTLTKLLAAVLAVLMIVSLAACTKTPASSTAPASSTTESKADTSKDDDLYYNKTGYPIAKQLITIKAAGPDWNNGRAWEETLMCKDWVTKFNIQMESNISVGDAWKTTLAQMIAGDSLPDLILNAGLTEADAQKYGGQGYFANLAEYKDLMPEMYKRFEATPAYRLYLSDEKGAIYGLSELMEYTNELLNRVYMSQKWLDNLGLGVPTTTDELYKVLTEFKNKDANKNGKTDDEIPLGIVDKWNAAYIYRMLMEAYGINTKDHDLPLVVNNDKVEFAGLSDNYKAYLKYLRKLYQEGLIYKGMFTDEADQLKSVGVYANDAIGMMGEAPFLVRGSEISTDADMVFIGGLTSEVNDKQYVAIRQGVESDIKILVPQKSEYKEAVVRLIDYYYSDEGYPDAISGPLGVSWEYAEEPAIGMKVRKLLRPAEGFKSDEDFRANYAIINGGFTVYQTIEFIGRGNMYKLTDEKLKSDEVIAKYGWAAISETGLRREGNIQVKDFYPVMSYTAEEATARTTLVTDIKEYMGSALASFVTDKSRDVDAQWNDYVTSLKNFGVDNLVKLEQGAYDRYIKNAK